MQMRYVMFRHVRKVLLTCNRLHMAHQEVVRIASSLTVMVSRRHVVATLVGCFAALVLQIGMLAEQDANWNGGYAAPTSDLTGVYAGLHAGVGFGSASRADVSGFAGGGQVGLNVQSGPVVAGVELDASLSGLGNTGFIESVNQLWLGSGRARAGYATDRFLVY